MGKLGNSNSIKFAIKDNRIIMETSHMDNINDVTNKKDQIALKLLKILQKILQTF